MSYRVIIAEVATGIVRRFDKPTIRYEKGGPGIDRTFVEKEDDALRLKDDLLSAHHDLEVVVGIEGQADSFKRYFYQDGQIVSD